MGLLDAIVGGGVGKLVKDVVGSFRLSPAAQMEFDTKLVEYQYQLAVKDRELEAKLAEFQAREIESASANIRAEVQSGDAFTSRARPSFLYACIAVVVNNWIVLPWAGKPPVDLPAELYWLMGVCITGYVASRGYEKVMAKRVGK